MQGRDAGGSMRSARSLCPPGCKQRGVGGMHSGWEDGHGYRASVERTAAACNAGGGRSLKRTALSGFAERPVRASRERLLHAMAVDRVSCEPFSGLNSLLIGKITGSPSLLLLLPRCFTVTPLPISWFSSPCSENHEVRRLSTSDRSSFWVLDQVPVSSISRRAVTRLKHWVANQPSQWSGNPGPLILAGDEPPR